MRDTANESGSLDRPRVTGTGVDREFSARTGHRGSQNACTAGLVFWNHRQPAAGWYATGSAPWDGCRRRTVPL